MAEQPDRRISGTDEWIGSDGPSTRRWSKPQAKEGSPTSSPSSSSSRVRYDDFLGGSSVTSSPERLNRPKPIQIDGLRSSIKDNPFLKGKIVH